MKRPDGDATMPAARESDVSSAARQFREAIGEWARDYRAQRRVAVVVDPAGAGARVELRLWSSRHFQLPEPGRPQRNTYTAPLSVAPSSAPLPALTPRVALSSSEPPTTSVSPESTTG